MAVSYVNDGAKGLSYSRMQKLVCPRKYEIRFIIGFDPEEDKPHFHYGHLVAGLVQEYFLNKWKYKDTKSEEDIRNLSLLSAMKEWQWPEVIPNEWEFKKKRTLPHAIYSYRCFLAALDNPDSDFYDIAQEYELATVRNRFGVEVPAVELEFFIELPEGYSYEGHIDLILQHKVTKEMIVWEGKTTSNNTLHPAMYKNSLQALGYTMVTDHIAVQENRSTAKYVDYFVWQNKAQEWNRLRFHKSLSLRADFLATLQVEVGRIELMKKHGTFPRNGDECFNFYSPCEVYDKCHAKNSTLALFAKKDRGMHEERMGRMDFVFTMEDITRTQIQLAENPYLIGSDAPEENEGDGQVIMWDD